MWLDSLKQIKISLEKYGEEVNVGLSSKVLNKVINVIEKNFESELPLEYFSIFTEFNGLDYNGFIIYGIDNELIGIPGNCDAIGLLEMNNIWHENENLKEYIFIGDSNISWYCYEPKRKVFVELDKPSGTLIKQYNKFDDFLSSILSDSLL